MQAQLENVKGIEVRAVPLYNTLSGGIRQDLPVLFQIMSGKKESIKRKPLNVAIVLDRSGSMRGASFNNSIKAIKELISQLAITDTLHLVVYDTVVDTILTNVNSKTENVGKKVDAIKLGGCTNLFAGVERGVDLVIEHHRNDAIDAVFLFSDGHATEGILEPEEIGVRIKKFHTLYGIRFTTFGLGSDFNEQLMSSIARCGKGNYFFIDHALQIPELVTKAYNGFTNLVAENLVFHARGINDTVLNELSGCTDLMVGKHYNLLREYGFYQFLAKCTVSSSIPNDFTIIGGMPILQWKLTFDDLEQGKKEMTGTVDISVTDDLITDKMGAPAVIVYQTMLKCGEINEQAVKALRAGNRNKVIVKKKQVIAEYTRVLELDEYGFVAELLKREHDAISQIEKQGITQRTSKIATYATIAAPGSKYERLSYEEDEEDDQDISYIIRY